jgi:hypothetical protein
MSRTPPSRGRWSFSLGLLALSCLINPASLSGQDLEVDLVGVEQRMAEGRFESARSGLQAWLETTEPSASWEERQRGIWLRALLTIDTQMAERDLRRLVIEYPGGPYSGRALLRLVRGAQARSDASRALSYLGTLLSDYPQSALQAEARLLYNQIAGAGQSP